MQFSLSEVREARLAPIVNFKGRKSKVNLDEDIPQQLLTDSFSPDVAN
jgi:hypothetical protein